ncbi:MAG: MFS transporter [Bacteroidota bacterium]
MSNTKWIFAAACMGMLLFGITMISLGATLPDIAEKFDLDGMEMGALASILPMGILIGSFVFGPLVDRYGYKLLLIVCCALVMVGLEGIAFAGSWVQIQLAIFLIGTGGGALNGATNALVADISEGNRGARLSLLGVFYGLGALGMPVLLASLSQTFSSESIIAGMGASIVLILVYLAVLSFPQPKQKQGFPLQKGIQLLKSPVLLLLSLILFFQSGLEGLVNNWTTTFLQSDLQIDNNRGLVVLTVLVGALTAMRLVLGKLLERYSGFAILAVGTVFVAVGAGMLWMVESYQWILCAYILMGIGFAGVFPITLGQIGDLWPDISGTAFSIALAISLIGNICINYLMGWISHQYDIGNFPLFILILILMFGVVAFFAWKQVQKISS